MRLNHGVTAWMLSATLLVFGTAMTACATGGRYYDSYGHDYHRWNRGEDRLYRQWELNTHRRHLDFSRRSAGDKHAYWGWRHR